jgi:hypothetical protein
VVALVLLAVSLRPFHAASDDQACSAWPDALSAHGSDSSLSNQTGLASGAQDHCAICHWTRLLRSPLTPAGVTISAATAATTLEKSGTSVYVAPIDDHLPARAPPAFLG